MQINTTNGFYSNKLNYFSLNEHIEKVTQIYNENFTGDPLVICQKLCYSFTYLFENKNSKKLRNIFDKVFQKCEIKILDQFIKKIVEKGFEKDFEKIHNFLLKFISLDHLEKIYQLNSPKEINSIHKLAEIISTSFKKKGNAKIKKSFINEFKRTFSFLFNFIPNIINTFLIAFSLFDIGKEPQTAWEASSMLDVYYKFIMIPSAVVVVLSILIPVVGIKLYAIAAAILLLSSLFLFIYIKWIRPCPNRLPHATNLTEDAKLGRMNPVVGRNKEINHLISLFSSLKKNVSKHVILVGPSGIGKTEIIKGFVQKIIKTKNKVNGAIKDLKNKKIFTINTASIISGGNWGFADQLTYLMSRIKGYERKVIFFFDEIHAAFKDKKSTLSDFLKPLLDRGGIHCIAATTSEEYNKFVLKDTAFARRLERMDIEEMNKADLKRVLQSLIKDWCEKILIDNDTLEKVIQKTNLIKKNLTEGECSSRFQQPAFAVQVLTQVIKKSTFQLDKDFIPTELSDLRSRLKSLKITMSQDSNYYPTEEKGKQLLKKMEKIKLRISKINSRSK